MRRVIQQYTPHWGSLNRAFYIHKRKQLQCDSNSDYGICEINHSIKRSFLNCCNLTCGLILIHSGKKLSFAKPNRIDHHKTSRWSCNRRLAEFRKLTKICFQYKPGKDVHMDRHVNNTSTQFKQSRTSKYKWQREGDDYDQWHQKAIQRARNGTKYPDNVQF